MTLFSTTSMFLDPIRLLRSVMTKQELRLKFMQIQVALQNAEQSFGKDSLVVEDLHKTADMLWKSMDGGPLKREHFGG